MAQVGRTLPVQRLQRLRLAQSRCRLRGLPRRPLLYTGGAARSRSTPTQPLSPRKHLRWEWDLRGELLRVGATSRRNTTHRARQPAAGATSVSAARCFTLRPSTTAEHRVVVGAWGESLSIISLELRCILYFSLARTTSLFVRVCVSPVRHGRLCNASSFTASSQCAMDVPLLPSAVTRRFAGGT